MMGQLEARNYLRAKTGRIPATLTVLAAGFCLICGLIGPSYGGAVPEVNAGRGGQPIELKQLPVRGKITVVDFFSPYCPPCLRLAPLLEQLAQKRSDLVIKKVNIQRPEVSGRIDWQSPLAQQFQLHSIPHLMIFNQRGRLEAQGPEAMKQVVDWLKETGLLK
jgi:thiol-disulfide isomerase/thioredoxin